MFRNLGTEIIVLKIWS